MWTVPVTDPGAGDNFVNVSSAEFERFASEFAGRDLSGVFAIWLHTTGKPPQGTLDW